MIEVYRNEVYRNSSMYDGKPQNDLSDFLQNSTDIETFKHNYKMYNFNISFVIE